MNSSSFLNNFATSPLAKQLELGLKRDRAGSIETDSELASNCSTTYESVINPHERRGKKRRLEAAATLRTEAELKNFLAGEHPLIRRGKDTEDFSAVLLVHSQWDRPKFSIPETVQRYNKLTTAFQMTTLPSLSVFCVDVDDIGIEETSELLQLRTAALPILQTYRFNSAPKREVLNPLAGNQSQFIGTKVVEKSLSEQRHDEEALLKVVRSASQVEPVHSLNHLKHRLALQADGTYTIVWYSASWCPPCRRVAESIPEIITRIPNNCVQILKVDKDQVQPVYDHFGVQKIPTFQVFSNGSQSESFQPKAALQNSQATQVISFIDQNCAALKFDIGDDEDF